MKTKVLFILKRKDNYNLEKDNHVGVITGLYNSASFVNQMLIDSGIESNMVVVIDNNDIDREVNKFKPTHVIIEALWVVPSKFAVLCRLHPTVKWIIRLHSEVPFLANEGMAFDWIGEYVKYENLFIGINAPRAYKEMFHFLSLEMGWTKAEADRKLIYMPNYYPTDYKHKKLDKKKDHIDIGCFGAVRPLKNHMLQAMAAVKFADKIGKKLKFHINSGRLEMKGEPVLHNLKGLFGHLHHHGHELIMHEWRPRAEFLELCALMDIGLQSSFSETFNIVGADIISQGVPLVGSKEIPWMSHFFCAKPTESDDIYKALCLTYKFPRINVVTNQNMLTNYVEKTSVIWENYFINN